MSNAPENVQRIGRQQLIEFTQGCLRARSTSALVKELVTTIVPACEMDIAALVIPNRDGQSTSYIGTAGVLPTAQVDEVKQHLVDVTAEVLETEVNPDHLRVEVMDRLGASTVAPTIESTQIMWTIELGTEDYPTGILCLFGPDATNLNQQAILDLRVAGTLLTDAIERINQETSTMTDQTDTTSTEPDVIMFEIGHFEAIKDVFGIQQARSLSSEIVTRISECLPDGSSIAQVDHARIVAIVQDTTVPTGFLVEKCLAACRNIEIAEKILVSVRSAVAPTVLVTAGIHQPLLPSLPEENALWHTLGADTKVS